MILNITDENQLDFNRLKSILIENRSESIIFHVFHKL